MLRQVLTVALPALTALSSLTVATAQEPKQVGGEKQIAVDLGGGVKLDLVLIPAGEFIMGDDNDKPVLHEKPVHKVKITKPFYLGKYEVTQEQWEAVMGSNPSYSKGPRNPVESVSWDDCQEFLKKLNAKVVGAPSPQPSPGGHWYLHIS